MISNINQKIEHSLKTYINECPEVKTIIHWDDLYKGHYLELDNNFQKEIFEKAVKKAGNYCELGRVLSIGRKTISACSKGKCSPQIKVLYKISNYVIYPLDDINSKIIEVSGLKPKLPFQLHNKEGAEIRAAFLSDGHIDKNQTSPAQYCAYELELHERLVSLCKEVFGEFEARTYFNNGSHITKFPAVIGRALELSGVPKGDKRLANSHLPKDILLGNKEIQIPYLRRVFDDEGDVCFDKHGKRAVRITRSVNINYSTIEIPSERWVRFQLPDNIRQNLLSGEQLLLLKLGIDARLYPEGIYNSKNGNLTAKWRIQIAQQDQLKKFAELIGFNLDRKRQKLREMIKSYQFRKLPNGKAKNESLDFIENTIKNKGFFKYSDLAKEIVKSGRSYDMAGRYIRFFLEQKRIKKIKRGIYTLDTN